MHCRTARLSGRWSLVLVCQPRQIATSARICRRVQVLTISKTAKRSRQCVFLGKCCSRSVARAVKNGEDQRTSVRLAGVGLVTCLTTAISLGHIPVLYDLNFIYISTRRRLNDVNALSSTRWSGTFGSSQPKCIGPTIHTHADTGCSSDIVQIRWRNDRSSVVCEYQYTPPMSSTFLSPFSQVVVKPVNIVSEPGIPSSCICAPITRVSDFPPLFDDRL